MIVLGTMAATGANLGPLDTTASTKPLLVTMLILLAASAALCWQTMLGGPGRADQHAPGQYRRYHARHGRGGLHPAMYHVFGKAGMV